MRQPFRRASAVLAVLAVTAIAGASSASATTLETSGFPENAAITLKTSVASGGSILLTDTAGVTAHTCTSASLEGTTTKFTGTVVEGVFSVMSWSNCTEGNPVVDAKGTFSIAWLSNTKGTLRWNSTNWTTPTFFGTLTCTTNSTDIGTVNGVKEGTATVTVNAVLSCTVIGSAKWSGTYTITSPLHLGVTS